MATVYQFLPYALANASIQLNDLATAMLHIEAQRGFGRATGGTYFTVILPASKQYRDVLLYGTRMHDMCICQGADLLRVCSGIRVRDQPMYVAMAPVTMNGIDYIYTLEMESGQAFVRAVPVLDTLFTTGAQFVFCRPITKPPA
jgi:hypothetical protein